MHNLTSKNEFNQAENFFSLYKGLKLKTLSFGVIILYQYLASIMEGRNQMIRTFKWSKFPFEYVMYFASLAGKV